MLNQGRMVSKFVGRDSSFLFQTKVYQVHNNFCHSILGRFIKQNNPIICGEALFSVKRNCALLVTPKNHQKSMVIDQALDPHLPSDKSQTLTQSQLAPNITERALMMVSPCGLCVSSRRSRTSRGALGAGAFSGWLEDQPWERQWQWLVFDTGGAITILKNMSSSMGMMISYIMGK